ncbi:hypothetical protein M2149_000923 [Lachnospiraceae bacterium PFB1-21]
MGIVDFFRDAKYKIEEVFDDAKYKVQEIGESILDTASDIVQDFTGETERRSLVQGLKDLLESFKQSLEESVKAINAIISNYNSKINTLNATRKGKVKDNIDNLYIFLGKFGKPKDIGSYAAESALLDQKIPAQQLETVEQYIESVDWDFSERFGFSLSQGIFLKSSTRKECISLTTATEELKMESERILTLIENRKKTIAMAADICDIYKECVGVITKVIGETVIPELNLIEAFFQANAIKDEVLSGNELSNISFDIDVASLENTLYQKHYNFIKNTFMFYVISCKIYNTAVLTKLINGNVEKSDLNNIENSRKVLLIQKGKVVDTALISEGRA